MSSIWLHVVHGICRTCSVYLENNPRKIFLLFRENHFQSCPLKVSVDHSTFCVMASSFYVKGASVNYSRLGTRIRKEKPSFQKGEVCTAAAARLLCSLTTWRWSFPPGSSRLCGLQRLALWFRTRDAVAFIHPWVRQDYIVCQWALRLC